MKKHKTIELILISITIIVLIFILLFIKNPSIIGHAVFEESINYINAEKIAFEPIEVHMIDGIGIIENNFKKETLLNEI